MKKNTVLAIYVMFVAITILSMGQILKAQKTKVTNPGVKAEFAFCNADDFNCETANRVKQDRAGSPYVDAQEGVSAVFNLASGTKDLTINLITSQRSVWFDFRDVAYYGNPQPSWWETAPQQNVKPHFNVLGAYKAKELCGTAATCNINFVTKMNSGNWRAAGNNTDYTLQWNPSSTQPFINTPETTSGVNVNYIKDSAGEVFIITPLPNANSSRVIAGLQGTLSRTTTASGQYVMPFTLTVRFK
ncbi:MAG: hypothetical protein M3209_07190 [Acidobacteriota bacterium]|nr:hypothetical protein [Acidobacteriota bacterium]